MASAVPRPVVDRGADRVRVAGAPAVSAKEPIETPEYADMLERMIRAYARRVADADDVDLGRMVEVLDTMRTAVYDAVAGQRAGGASWADVARGLGTTRQAAQITYGRRHQRGRQ